MKKFIAIIAVIATFPVSSLAGQVKVDKDSIRCGLHFKKEAIASVSSVQQAAKTTVAK